jgi:hypothetical protein
MIFGTAGTQFSTTVSQSAVVYVRWRCQRRLQNWTSWMIFRSTGTHFSSTVSEPAVFYVRWRFLSQQYSSRRTGFRWWFLGRQGVSFVNDFLVRSSLCALKISAPAIEPGSDDDLYVGNELFFINDFWVSRSLCALKISASIVEVGFEDDFLVSIDSGFGNDFWVSSSLCTMKISTSAVELGSVDDF